MVTNDKFKQQVFATKEVGGRPIRLQLDTGATCNVIRTCELNKGQVIQPTGQTLSMYSKDTITTLGKCKLNVKNPKTKEDYSCDFVVVTEAATSILGATTVHEMGLIAVKYDIILIVKMIPGTTTLHGLDKDQSCTRYQNIFEEELGCFEGEFHLDIDPTIRKVEQPTDWVSCLITVK